MSSERLWNGSVCGGPSHNGSLFIKSWCARYEKWKSVVYVATTHGITRTLLPSSSWFEIFEERNTQKRSQYCNYIHKGGEKATEVWDLVSLSLSLSLIIPFFSNHPLFSITLKFTPPDKPNRIIKNLKFTFAFNLKNK